MQLSQAVEKLYPTRKLTLAPANVSVLYWKPFPPPFRHRIYVRKKMIHEGAKVTVRVLLLEIGASAFYPHQDVSFTGGKRTRSTCTDRDKLSPD